MIQDLYGQRLQITMNKLLIFSGLLLVLSGASIHPYDGEDIVGKWMSTEKNLEVEVFRVNNEYKATLVWFDDSDDKSDPMSTRCDKKNSRRELRSRKIIGLEVMHGLTYNPDDNEWQNGWIYDSSTGKIWNAKAWLTKDGLLKVRGYWHFEFLGRNMSFNKVI